MLPKVAAAWWGALLPWNDGASGGHGKWSVLLLAGVWLGELDVYAAWIGGGCSVESADSLVS